MALFAFKNNVTIVYPINDTVIVSGNINDLILSRQPARGVALEGGAGELHDGVWLHMDLETSPYGSNIGRWGVRVVALTGLRLPDPFSRDDGDHYIRVYGGSQASPGGALTWEMIGDLYPFHYSTTDGALGNLVNRILPLPTSGEAPRYRAIRVNIRLGDLYDPIKVGGVWASNAVEVEDGVLADWEWGVTSHGRLQVSNGGSAYATPGVALRTFRGTFGGRSFSDREAFGAGVSAGTADAENAETEWMSAAAMHLADTGPCIIVPRVNSEFFTYAMGMYGHLTRPIRIQHLAGGLHQCTIEMEEEK